MAWQIKDWNDHFENSRSRAVDSISWVPFPNKHDGKGYAKIANHPKRCEIFTVWILTVQLASKMPERGVLADADGDLTFEDMELKTKYPKKLFETWLPWLAKETKWIINPNLEDYQSGDRPTAEGVVVVRKKRIEGNGIEQNGTEQNAIPADLESDRQIIESWLAYKRERGDTYKPQGLKALWAVIREIPPDKRAASITNSIASGWKGIYEKKGGGSNGSNASASDRITGEAGYKPGKYANLGAKVRSSTEVGNSGSGEGAKVLPETMPEVPAG